MKAFIFLALLAAAAFAFQSNVAQRVPRPTRPDVANPAFAGKDGWEKFDAAEHQYTEDLINWTIDQRIQTSGKQITVNAAPAPGRFQIFINPNVRADAFLLDTETGKIWTAVQVNYVSGQPTIWKYHDRIDSATDFEQWQSHQTLTK